MADWRDGPGLDEALDQAESWQDQDPEPGTGPGEYAIVHLRRDVD